MQKKKYFSLLVFLCSSTLSLELIAQETVVPLLNNPVIIKERAKYSEENFKALTAVTAIGDTLSLPFIDDFSHTGIFPEAARWTDSTVFINSDFPVNPPTIGVATFDGINKFGGQYNPSLTSYGVADTLTSKPIDLNFPNDTSIWLSFFLQPQGLGSNMQVRDSIYLEFFGSDSAWHFAWSKKGSTTSLPFAQTMINIRDSIYLFSGFRFRFLNKASLYAMHDQWNLDYVRLDTGRSAADTVIVNDVAFVKRGLSTLKKYQSVPYPHYKNDSCAVMEATKKILLRNLDTVSVSVNHHMEFLDQNLFIDFTTIPVSVSINASDTISNPINFSPFCFPVNNAEDSLLYYVRNIKTNPDNNAANDTLLERQEMYNYYAYDDGTAEWGYGIVGPVGSQIAYKFDLLMGDTLRAIQMRFVYGNTNVSLSLFNIVMWSSVIPANGQTVLLYSQHPYYEDTINGFHTYRLDNPVYIPGGIVYIGWEQLDNSFLNIGLDKNINSNANMFFNVSGNFQNSSIAGSWMIRPVFGKELPGVASVGNVIAAENKISVYPNPASDFILIKNNSATGEKFFFRMFDVTGRTVANGEVKGQRLNVSNLSNGIYQLVFSDNSFRTIASRKIIISR